MTWLGHSDFLGYAARGGDQAQVPIPDAATLGGYFQSSPRRNACLQILYGKELWEQFLIC